MRNALRVSVVGVSLGAFFACSTPPKTEVHRHRHLASMNNFSVMSATGDADDADCTDVVSKSQQDVIDASMGTHGHRLYHYLWHATRNSWTDLNKKERAAIQTLDPEWGKNAPICPAGDPEYQDPKTGIAGEEFLLMHHEMVAHLRAMLKDAGEKCIRGWKEPPAKDDEFFPVPDVPGDESKRDEFGTYLKSWSNQLRDPTFLKGKSLSYVGMIIEVTVHNTMHLRWAAKPVANDDFAPTEKAFTSKSLVEKVKFDDPATYHWLGNPYSSHVNPVFWKLHGWVDGTIQAWLGANGYETIAADCTGVEKCYQWKSAWVGGAIVEPEMVVTPADGTTRSPSSVSEESADPEMDAVLKKISVKAGFGNSKFRLPPARVAGPVFGRGVILKTETSTSDTFQNVEMAFRNFGPCSN